MGEHDDIPLTQRPRHIAIIMDGNGRWAAAKKFPRTQGHLEGVKRVEDIVVEAAKMRIEVLTLYTFSTENWNRPEFEVNMLMQTLMSVLHKKVSMLCDNNIRLGIIGRREGVPESVLNAFDEAVKRTSVNSGMLLNLAFNYGGRREIIDAVTKIAEEVKSGNLKPSDIDEKVFGNALYTAGIPDPDLLIRTSGEQRISNFLLWQLSYAEFYFTEKYWPEFDAQEFYRALYTYSKRERRYGKVRTSL